MSELQDIFDLAYFYLKFRLRSRREMRDYLYKKSKTRYFSHDMVDTVIEELEERGFLNDKAFVEAFVESRTKNRPKSEYILRQELRRFGIAEETVNEYFQTHIIDEEVLAASALQAKWRRFADLPDDKQFEKAASFLSRRGFHFDVIKKTIAKLREKE